MAIVTEVDTWMHHEFYICTCNDLGFPATDFGFLCVDSYGAFSRGGDMHDQGMEPHGISDSLDAQGSDLHRGDAPGRDSHGIASDSSASHGRDTRVEEGDCVMAEVGDVIRRIDGIADNVGDMRMSEAPQSSAARQRGRTT